MSSDSNPRDGLRAAQDRYQPDQNRTLSEAVLDAIEDYKGEELSMGDFVLYEDIDTDALDNLFRHDAEPRTTVSFDTDDVRVELYGDGGVVINVRDQPPR